MFDCAKCFPRLCTCPRSEQDTLNLLKLSLKSPIWSKKEREQIILEITELEKEPE